MLWDIRTLRDGPRLRLSVWGRPDAAAAAAAEPTEPTEPTSRRAQLLPRFVVSVVDCVPEGPALPPPPGGGGAPTCGALIVPPSRFFDADVAAEEAQLVLCRSTGFRRLIVVRLHPASRFAELPPLLSGAAAETAALQAELSSLMLRLAPRATGGGGVAKAPTIPFLCAPSPSGFLRASGGGGGGEGGRASAARHFAEGAPGSQHIVCEVDTAKSGVVWIVDRADAERDARTGLLGWCRRLLFLESVSGAVQSEVRLLAPPSGGGGAARAVDRSYLGSEAHAALAAGVVFGGTLAPTRAQRSREVVVLGGGGGALSSFLLAHFASVSTLTLVERDGAVLALAKRLLGLPGVLPAECAAFLDLGARCDVGVTVEAPPEDAVSFFYVPLHFTRILLTI